MIQIARPAFLPPHSNSNPPREKNKNGEGAKGEGGRAVLRAWGGMMRVTTQSERTKESQIITRSARAKSVEIFAKVGSSGVQ